MKLSPNFTLAEFTKSQTALRKGLDNTPDAKAIAALKALCVNVLEPVRKHFKKPVKITSGYRSEALSWAIGSKPTSQHCRGEAADFEIVGVSNHDVAAYIRDHLPFDQLILEFYTPGEPNSGWVHISYRADRLRRDVLTAATRPTGGVSYHKGLVA